jgi:large subunit ribosomal protein L19
MQVLHELEKELMNREFPKFSHGDTIKVHLKIVEGDKERIQIFQGVVIAINKKMNRGTFVVRKISAGNFGVERIIPFFSPSLDKIEVIKHGRVRRAKLYYLRNRSGKAARIAEKRRR